MKKRTRSQFVPYHKHLESRKFSVTKWIAYRLSFKRCTICFQRYHLEAHHLSYKVLGKWFEFFFIRYVCDNHHEQVGKFLGVRLHGTLALHLNYYRVKFGWLCTWGIYNSIRWVISSYSIGSDESLQRSARRYLRSR